MEPGQAGTCQVCVKMVSNKGSETAGTQSPNMEANTAMDIMLKQRSALVQTMIVEEDK